uniref:Uncharacterized protein n=1 Tax=Sphaerodactylus townsendi TaxID=933632 RepID=A0ACB8FHN1_9SAUR
MLLNGKDISQSTRGRKVELPASEPVERMRLQSFGRQSSNSYRSQHKNSIKEITLPGPGGLFELVLLELVLEVDIQ